MFSAAREATAEVPQVHAGALKFMTTDGYDIERLCAEVRNHRLTMLAAVTSLLTEADNPVMHSENIARGFAEISDMPPHRRRFMLEDPAFARWLDCIVVATRKLSEPTRLHALLQALPLLFARVTQRELRPSSPLIPGTSILVQRFEIDPVIKESTPPTYDFAAAELLAGSNDNVAGLTPTELFAQGLGVAFENIRGCDPRRHGDLQSLVQVIGYLPDADFRSCSAARYQGVVYLSGQETSIIDLEESIVHEAAHQLLYKISELDPIVDYSIGLGPTFELPWSGSQRDLFGYYHAFFIYLELVKYFDRRAATAGDKRAAVARKRQLIHRGLQLASKDIGNAEGLSPYGRLLFEKLQSDVNELGDRMVAAS